MLKIKFADDSEYEIHSDTTVYPSGSSTIRSRMEVHMAENTMTIDEFEAVMSDIEKTSSIRIVNYDLDETGKENVNSDIAYSSYTIVSSVGKKRCDVSDYTSGITTSEIHLVVVLEQLTYIEQKLAELGL